MSDSNENLYEKYLCEERYHMENLVNSRVTFLILIFSAFIASIVAIKNLLLLFLISLISTIISIQFSMAIARAHAKFILLFNKIVKGTKPHPAKDVDIELKQFNRKDKSPKNNKKLLPYSSKRSILFIFLLSPFILLYKSFIYLSFGYSIIYSWINESRKNIIGYCIPVFISLINLAIFIILLLACFTPCKNNLYDIYKKFDLNKIEKIYIIDTTNENEDKNKNSSIYIEQYERTKKQKGILRH